MGKLKITQVKSVIDRSKRQKATMVALGLTRINCTVIHEPRPEILGMIKKVEHLVRIEEVNE